MIFALLRPIIFIKEAKMAKNGQNRRLYDVITGKIDTLCKKVCQIWIPRQISYHIRPFLLLQLLQIGRNYEKCGKCAKFGNFLHFIYIFSYIIVILQPSGLLPPSASL